MKTKISWTNRSDWNPLRGCSRKTLACVNCYAEIMAARFSMPGQWGHGFAKMVRDADGKLLDHRWTGNVALIEERLAIPLSWKKRERCFASSTSDFFHEELSDDDIDALFAVMHMAENIDFQVLTKRWERMHAYFADPLRGNKIQKRGYDLGLRRENKGHTLVYSRFGTVDLPISNVWLGVSVHDQQCAEEAVPLLLETPAAIRFVSYEPALGMVDWRGLCTGHYFIDALRGIRYHDAPDGEQSRSEQIGAKIDLIIAGEESGPDRRLVDQNVFRSTRDQCSLTGTPFFLKQMHINGKKVENPELDGKQHMEMPAAWLQREAGA